MSTRNQKLNERQAYRFRRNLVKLAEAHGCPTENDLASRLGWKLEKKKWLRRCWKQGLQNTNPKTESHLRELAEFFGIELKDLWNPKLYVDQRQNFYAVFHILREWDAGVSERWQTGLDVPQQHDDGTQLSNRQVITEWLRESTPEKVAAHLYRESTQQDPPTASQKHLLKEIEAELDDLKQRINDLIEYKFDKITKLIYKARPLEPAEEKPTQYKQTWDDLTPEEQAALLSDEND